jgi:catechol 2,3-dioxygenase-like lactoylglutathione lyase family enzyme
MMEVSMTGRIQLALNVNDLGESIAFYRKLFGAEPAKVRPGYANFSVADPPLKLILMENPGRGGSLNHLGVEVRGTDAVDAEQARLAEVGLASVDERDTTCCYARQDKFWVEGAPNGERWEIYTVLEDSATFWGQDGGQSWDSVEATLDSGQDVPAQSSQCCGGTGLAGSRHSPGGAGGRTGALPFGRQRAGVSGAACYPLGKLPVGGDVRAGYPQPPRHRPAAHLRELRAGRSGERVRLGRVDTDHDPAVAAGGHGHVAADEEGEAAEHLLLRQAGLVGYQCADPVGESLVVGHPAMVGHARSCAKAGPKRLGPASRRPRRSPAR